MYQALLSGIESYRDLGNCIIREIKTAHAFRQAKTVKELAEILINIPIKEYRLIGQYYLILVQSLDFKYSVNDLEFLIEQSQTYKTKALLLRGAFEWFQGKIEPALCFYTESLKTITSTSDYLDAWRCVATAKAVEGFHNSALKDLESITPLLRYAEPIVYYDILNSFTVELAVAGRKYEARNVIKHVLESPFLIAYPEWQDTAEELKGSNRSFAVLNPTRRRKGKLLSMPVIEHPEPIEWHKPAPVISLETWKAKMVKNHEGLDSRELLLKIVELSTAPGMTDGKLLQVIQLMQRLLIEPQKPDDEPEA